MSEELFPDGESLLNYIAQNPHDRAFKLLMKHREVSIPYLKSKLPPSLRERIHWDDLCFLPTEFLDEFFQEQRSDLLIKLPYGKNENCIVHILFEHQRAHDSTMPFRLLKYMVAIWTDIEKERKTLWKEQKENELPPTQRVNIYPLPSIFPVVLYNGLDTWTTPTSLAKSGLFDIPPGMKPYFPEFQYELSDLCHMKEVDFAQYKEHKHCYHILKFQSQAHSGKILQAIQSMIEYLVWAEKDNPQVGRILFILALYIEEKDINTQKQIVETLRNELTKGDTMPIILEKFKQEWKNEGRLEGQQEGRLEGQQETNRTNARSMLQKGLKVQLIAEITGLTLSEIQALKDKDE